MEREIINLEINYDINKLNRLIRGSLNTVIFDRPQTKNRILEKIINTVNNNIIQQCFNTRQKTLY